MATKETKKSPRRRPIKDPNQRILFDQADFEILDLTLAHNPELRICAGTVKAARAIRLKYPIKSAKSLFPLLPTEQLFVEGHSLRPALIARYMPDKFFPIEDERALISRCYIALIRCRDDMAWAARAPSYAASLLQEFAQTTGQKGSL